MNYPYGTVYANSFVGDGSGLFNLPGGTDVSSWGDPQVTLNGPVFNNSSSYFDCIGAAMIARTGNNAPNNFFNGYQNGEDFGTSGSPLGTIYAGAFVGDGSGLWNVGSGSTDLSNYTGNIGQSYVPMGAIYASSFNGDGSSMICGYAYTSGGAAAAQVPFNDFFSSITNYGSMDVGQSGGAIQNVYAQYFYGDGSGLTNVGGGTPDLSTYTGNIGGIWSPVGNIYTTCIGDSDNWIPNVFSENIEAGTIHADEYFVCYTGMSLPSPAPCGTICYSRHAGGHFYGMTDDGWKQLDS